MKNNPCLTCGACCSTFRISFYGGELLDGKVSEDLITEINSTYVCMKGSENGGRCIALIGQIGKDVKCSCYSIRPSVCRNYDVFDTKGNFNLRCNQARMKHGLKPLPKTKKEWLLTTL